MKCSYYAIARGRRSLGKERKFASVMKGCREVLRAGRGDGRLSGPAEEMHLEPPLVFQQGQAVISVRMLLPVVSLSVLREKHPSAPEAS